MNKASMRNNATLALLAAYLAHMPVKEENQVSPARDWSTDRNKKNVGPHDCNKCGYSFFGKLSRKYCHHCQDTVAANLVSLEKAQAEQRPWARAIKPDRIHGR